MLNLRDLPAEIIFGQGQSVQAAHMPAQDADYVVVALHKALPKLGRRVERRFADAGHALVVEILQKIPPLIIIQGGQRLVQKIIAAYEKYSSKKNTVKKMTAKRKNEQEDKK